MKSSPDPVRGSLAKRLLRIVFGLYLVVVVFSVLGQMGLEYRYQKECIRQEFLNIKTTFEPVLAQAIWNLDEAALRAAVEGMIELPVLVGMRVRDENGSTIAVGGMVKNGTIAGETRLQVRISGCSPEDETFLAGEAYRFELFAGEFPIRHTVHSLQKVLGRVTIYSNTSVILKRVKMNFLLLGGATVLEVGLLGLIFRLVFTRILERPLVALTGTVRRVTLDNLGSAEVPVLSGGHDELGELAESFTRMLRDLQGEITGRKEADENRRASQAKLDSIMSVAPEGIGLIQNRMLDSVNQALCDITGYRREELLGQGTRRLYSTEEAYLHGEEALFARVAQQGLGRAEVSWLRKDGRTVDILLSAAALVPQDPASCITFVAMDISERKQTEERLRQADKMSAIGQLAGGIAHDFNNQLGGILGYAEMLIKRLDDDTLRRYAENIMRAARRSADLTAQLLAFSRKGKYLSVPTDMHKVLAEVVELLRRSIDKRIEIKQHLEATPCSVLGDPTQLQNAVFNLALNARDAMPQGGVLTFSTRVITQEAGRPDEELMNGRYLELCVTDTGTGMDAETKKRLFEPFFTTKEVGKGTGLGLASVYGTVKNHQGAVRVYSEPGRGSSFHLYLPVYEDAEAVQEPLNGTRPVSGHGHILIVDDEPIILELGSEVLRNLGYEVSTCGNPEEALDLYCREWERIDLVLLDMVMPKLGGSDLFQAMKRVNPEIRALLSSGYSINGEAQSILDLGVIAFVQKPFDQAELSQKVAEALGQRQ